MGKRERTEAQRAAGRTNLAKGRAIKDAMRDQAAKDKRPKAGDRWKLLLDGQLTVKDLDDEEVAKMKVRGKDGGFAGRRRAIPSHLIQAFQAENIRRTKSKFTEYSQDAADLLLDLAKDDDVKPADRIKILMFVMDHSVGKPEERITVTQDDPWGRLISESLDVDRDLSDLAGGQGSQDDSE